MPPSVSLSTSASAINQCFKYSRMFKGAMYRARPALQPHQIASHSHLQPLQNSAYYFKIIS